MNRTAIGGWLLVLAVGCYLAFEDATWRVPMPGGVPAVPILALAAIVVAGGCLLAGRRIEPVLVLAALAIVASLLFDATFFEGVAFRDLGIYLNAGLHFRLGQPVYLEGLVTALPADPTAYPYLYPPPTLPFAALLSSLPVPIVTAAWEAGLLAASIAGLRLLGLRWRWCLVLLAWPPFAQGLYVGNVALPLFLLFAAGPWAGGGLLAGALLKPQGAIAGLWLIRERRWRAVLGGIAILAVLVLLTLPLTGVERWTEWLDGLRWFSQSQALVPRTFYGLALAEYVPGVVALGAALAVIALALLGRSRAGLARVGVATVVASPSLYAHGFTVALPALLELRAVLFWTAIAVTSVSGGPTWFAALGLVVAGWFVPAMRRPAPDSGSGGDELHPLGDAAGPWPGTQGPDAPARPAQG
jgi:hypothetical protein